MFISAAVLSFTDYLRSKLEPNFFILNKICYDPNLAFDIDIHKDILEKSSSERSSADWILIYWNRQGLSRDVPQPRSFRFKVKDIQSGTATDNIFQLRKLPINFGFYSNSLDILEAVEEQLSFDIQTGVDFPITANYPVLGDMTTDIFNVAFQSLEKLERPTRGSLAMLSYSCEIVIPVVKFEKNVQLIQQIQLRINDEMYIIS